MSEEKLEQRVNTKHEIDIGRVAWTTIGYGIVGSFAPNPDVFVPASAAMGCALSIYDEAKNKGLDLYTPAVSALIGGVVGSFFDRPNFNEQIPHLTVYAGAVIGGVLSMYNSITKAYKKKSKNTPAKKLNEEVTPKMNF